MPADPLDPEIEPDPERHVSSFEDGLKRRMLAADLGDLAVDEDLARVRGRGRTRSRHLVVTRAAAAVVLLLLGATSVAVLRTRDEVTVRSGTADTAGPSSTDGPPGSSDATATTAGPVGTGSIPAGLTVTQPFAVDRGAGPMIVAFGSAWLGVPASNDLSAGVLQVSSDSTPTAGGGGRRLEVGTPVVALTSDASSVYAATWDDGVRRGAVVRIDPVRHTTEQLGSLDVPVTSIAVAGGALWHTGFVRSEDGRQVLARVRLGDVPADEEPASIVMPMTSATLVASAGSLWALHDDRLTVLDPRDDIAGPDRVRADITIGRRPTSLAAWTSTTQAGVTSEGVWVGTDAGELQRYSGTTFAAAGAPVQVGEVPLDLADRSNPLATNLFVLVGTDPSGPVSSWHGNISQVTIDDTNRTSITDLDVYEDMHPVGPIRPTGIEVEGPVLWVLDGPKGWLWRLAVGAGR